jgi:hypothetical protein
MDLRETSGIRSVVYYLEPREQLSNSPQWSHIAAGALRDCVPNIGFLQMAVVRFETDQAWQDVGTRW